MPADTLLRRGQIAVELNVKLRVWHGADCDERSRAQEN